MGNFKVVDPACENEQREPKAPPDTVTSSPTGGASCLAAVTAASCQDGQPQLGRTGCADVYQTSNHGTTPLGQPCQVSSDCVAVSGGTSYCSTDTWDGFCVGIRWEPLGGDCGSGSGPDLPELVCEDGLHCKSGACAPYRQAGETCGSWDPCVCGTLCDGRVCAVPLLSKDGDPCEGKARCRYPSRCDAGTCKARPVPSCSLPKAAAGAGNGR